ncbi:hypothetical protein EG329_010762 [Mollisiaceae sp. DMI_Dod_QoI]|nr:hypothetical protein EG329_010762 [Helotiales sp. DMI_Dod_QoI]
MQEIFSAADISVQCGRDIVPWNALVEFQSWLTAECFGTREANNAYRPGIIGNYLWRQRGAASFEQMRTCLTSADRFIDLSRLRHAGYAMDENYNNLTLENLLLQHWDAVATNPRDKIFAIFRLASDGDEYDIDVDYQTTVQELFSEVVKSTIRLTGKLSIILPRRPGNPEHNLPSWCPDWSSSEPASKLGNWQDVYPFQVARGSREYCAGLDSIASVRFGATRRSLVAKGFVLDVVRRTSHRPRQPVVPEPKRNCILSLLSRFSATERYSNHPRPAEKFENWYSVLRRTLRANFRRAVTYGTIREGNSSFRKFCRKQHENFFWVLHRATNILSHELPHENRFPDTRDYLERWKRHGKTPKDPGDILETMTDNLRSVCTDMGREEINEHYTNFFVTKEAHLGLGPTEMLMNDQVVVLFGSDVPVVLRWEGSSYRLIGQCYVVGAMHGEMALAQRRRFGVDVDRYPDFEIR